MNFYMDLTGRHKVTFQEDYLNRYWFYIVSDGHNGRNFSLEECQMAEFVFWEVVLDLPSGIHVFDYLCDIIRTKALF